MAYTLYTSAYTLGVDRTVRSLKHRCSVRVQKSHVVLKKPKQTELKETKIGTRHMFWTKNVYLC